MFHVKHFVRWCSVICDILNMKYNNEFDVITVIQVNYYLSEEERKIALKNVMMH